MTAIGKIATFQVRPDALDECVAAIATFVRAVGENEPGTLFYSALQDASDPTRFTHLFAFADADAEAFHRGTPWVKAFTDTLYPRTVDGVTFADHRLVADARPRSRTA